MLTVKEILTNKIALDIECVDRVYLNGYVKYLQMTGGLITFIREQMGFPIPSPMVMRPFTEGNRKAVESIHNKGNCPSVKQKLLRIAKIAPNSLIAFQNGGKMGLFKMFKIKFL